MRVAVFSDTHSNTALMLEAVRRTRPDVIIHLGDHDRDTECLRREFPEIALYKVRGNCDFYTTAPERDVVPLGQVKAFITHGHLYNVDWSTDSLAYAAQEAECQIAMFGHTHKPYMKVINGVTCINPGSISFPRQLDRRPSYLVIDISEEGEFSYHQVYLDRGRD